MQNVNFRYYKFFIFFLFAALFITSRADSFEKSFLHIQKQNGSLHEFQIEVATTQKQHQQGLMFRKNIPENYGMLFLFQTEKIINMWMKNTLVSLDMIFIDKTQKIILIVDNTKPYSTKSISSIKPALSVLEVAAGVAKKIGIKKGDTILFQNKR